MWLLQYLDSFFDEVARIRAHHTICAMCNSYRTFRIFTKCQAGNIEDRRFLLDASGIGQHQPCRIASMMNCLLI